MYVGTLFISIRGSWTPAGKPQILFRVTFQVIEILALKEMEKMQKIPAEFAIVDGVVKSIIFVIHTEMISLRYPTELKGEGTSNNDAIQSKTRQKPCF